MVTFERVSLLIRTFKCGCVNVSSLKAKGGLKPDRPPLSITQGISSVTSHQLMPIYVLNVHVMCLYKKIHTLS